MSGTDHTGASSSLRGASGEVGASKAGHEREALGRARPAKLPRWAVIGAFALSAVIAADTIIVSARWPFTEERIIRSLERATSSNVTIGGFRQTFLPFPGCFAEDVVIFRGSVPLARVRSISVQSSWTARVLLSRRIERVRVEGLHVRIPVRTPAPVVRAAARQSHTILSDVVAPESVIEFAREGGKDPLRFRFSELHLREVARQKKIQFRITAHHPIPSGDVRTVGAFGPWNFSDPRRTPLSGTFEFRNADLGSLDGVDGMLFSKGSLAGVLGRIEVRGRTETRGFRVVGSPNRVRLTTRYHCIVNGLTGDVVLNDVEASFGETILRVRGRVRAEAGQDGKTAQLRFSADRARIEDLLRLFTSSPRPALSGALMFRASVAAPPGDAAFLKKLRLDGAFEIHGARFTTPTQNKVDELSARARGQDMKERNTENPDRALANLSGSVLLNDGVAKLANVSFELPGATARGGGTYNVISKQVNLKGALSMDVALSKTTGGFKSILLKPFELFMDKNRRGGSIVPVSITGTASRPVFQLHLAGR